MTIEPKDILVILSIAAILAGFFWWILGRVLTDKKDKLTLTFEIERIKERIAELEQDSDKIEPIQRDLDIIKEQIKHL